MASNRTPYVFISSKSSITVYIAGEAYTAASDHPKYQLILEEVKKGSKGTKSENKLINLFDTAQAVREYVGKTINISESGVLTHNGVVVDNVLTTKIVRMLSDGFDINPMLNFLVNLQKNPSFNSRAHLMTFMEHNAMPITTDGHILAYKAVKANYTDWYSGTFDNSIGQKPTMERCDVDDKAENHCSSGLHTSSYEYAKGFLPTGGHLMVLKINPADVVAVTSDCKFQKMRVSSYEVIDEVTDNTLEGVVINSKY